ncbi:MAG: TonB-dependent receptor [Alphaproteobacteria bacterium]|nr:TonB-dependent receptor [Alphaproteobacteria bacterium]
MRFKREFQLTVSAGALMMLLASAAPAVAQESAAPPPQAKTDEDRDVIIVTATRREAEVTDLPLSITAIQGDDLVKNAQDDLADYIRQVPGVTFRQQSAGLNQLSIRGVSGGGGQRAKAPISFYIDDVPVVSDPVASPDIKTFDIERVEVLRGPQGTLFGESALGGVIRILSKQPNLSKFEARTKVTYLSTEIGDPGYNFDGVVNIPIVEDEFAVRASLSRRDEGGWIDNIGIKGRENANDLDYWSGRVKALWKASDRLEISSTGSFVRSDYGSRQEANTSYKQTINYTNETRADDIDQFNVTVKYDFDFAELTSSSNMFKRETSRLFNLNSFNGFLPGVLTGLGKVPSGFQFDEFYQTLNIDDDAFNQEIRLVSTDEGPFRWVAGAYYFDTTNTVGVDFLGRPKVDFTYLRLRRFEDYNQKAVFAETEYDFSPQWTLVAGLRYTKESRTITYDQKDDFPTVVFLPADGLFVVNFDYEIVTPKFAIQYRPTDNLQVYASATRGFRGPGGNTDFNNSGARNNIYGAETIWSYEIGSKGTFFDDRLTLSAAAFSTDWNDRQEVVNPQAPPTQQYADNIGQAKITGAELVADLSVTDNISIGGNVSVLETEITSSARPTFVGLPLVGEPDTRGAIYADARYPLSNGLTLTAHADGVYQSEVIYSLTAPVKQGDYSLFNASVGLERDNWKAQLFARNVTDEFIKFGAGLSTSVNEPRLYGISFDVSF